MSLVTACREASANCSWAGPGPHQRSDPQPLLLNHRGQSEPQPTRLSGGEDFQASWASCHGVTSAAEHPGRWAAARKCRMSVPTRPLGLQALTRLGWVMARVPWEYTWLAFCVDSTQCIMVIRWGPSESTVEPLENI